MKGYALFEYDSCGDTLIKVFLDEQKCKDQIEKSKKSYDEIIAKCNHCEECKGVSGHEFKYKTVCSNAKILTDRYGEYCENDLDDNTHEEKPYYSYEAVEIVE